MEYAAALARFPGADTVKLRAYGADGVKADAALLLSRSSPLLVENTYSELPEPETMPPSLTYVSA